MSLFVEVFCGLVCHTASRTGCLPACLPASELGIGPLLRIGRTVTLDVCRRLLWLIFVAACLLVSIYGCLSPRSKLYRRTSRSTKLAHRKSSRCFIISSEGSVANLSGVFVLFSLWFVFVFFLFAGERRTKYAEVRLWLPLYVLATVNSHWSWQLIDAFFHISYTYYRWWYLLSVCCTVWSVGYTRLVHAY